MNKKLFYPLVLGLACIAQLSFGQGILYVKPLSTSAKPTGTGITTGSVTLNSILTEYEATEYSQSYATCKTPTLNLYRITVAGNADSLKQELLATGLFDTAIQQLAIPQLLCSAPVAYNDPFFVPGYGTMSKYQIEMIDAPCAWSITEGDPNVIAAIIDTEFDTEHEDLTGKFAYVTILNPEGPIETPHGTHVASLAGAIVNNNKGTAGSGNKISLAGYRVNRYSVGRGIEQAVEDGRRIVSVSWSGTGLTRADAERITKDGTVLIVGAGNIWGNVYHTNIATVPGVIVVSSVNEENKIRPTNHSHNEYVDVCAPGVRVVQASAEPFADYSLGTGTSNATPIVSGVVGLMLSVNPCLMPADVENILKSTCDPVADGAEYPGMFGAGRINAYEAVKAARDFNTTTNITANTTWSSNRVQAGDVVVKTGKTLTITAQVRMLCGEILVEKGAKLIVSGGHITSIHPEGKWKGISLYGYRDLSSAAANQGNVELKNGAIIENAIVGIANFTWNNGAQGGGIIKASNTTFLNCRRAVALNDYANYSYWVGTGNSNCSFDHCIFKIDDMKVMSSNPSSFPYLISSWNVLGGIKVVNSQFILSISPTEMPYQNRGFAIHLASTGGLVRDNTFEGFRYGINTTSYSGTPTRYVKVFRNQFDYNSVGIVIAGDAFADVRENDIANILPAFLADERDAHGIYIDQGRGAYIGCGNTISGITDAGPGATGINKYGIAVWATGAFSNTIIDNEIADCYTGLVTQLDNPNLGIACNYFNSNDYGLWADKGGWDGAGHRLKDQGTGCLTEETRAGNTFIPGLVSLKSGNYIMPWNYYAANRPEEVPGVAGTTVTITPCIDITTDANSQCNKPLNCVYSFNDLYDAGHLSDFTTRYSSLTNSGLRYGTEGRLLYGHIIRAYNDLGNTGGLQSFLEGQNDEESRRLLIPLYIERGLYSNAGTTINALSMSQSEKAVYTNYYNILKTLQQQGRRIDQLSPAEKATVEGIAAGKHELNAQAKALLEAVYNYHWKHIILDDPATGSRPAPQSLMQATTTTSLGDARPNPATAQVQIEANLSEADMRYGPVLVIRNSMGREVYRQALKAGLNSLDINLQQQPRGLYFYSLEGINTAPITRKLSLQ